MSNEAHPWDGAITDHAVVSAIDELWVRLEDAAKERNYGSAHDALADLHLLLKRPCANACGRLATKEGAHCAQCWAKTPAGRAKLSKVIGDTLRNMAPAFAPEVVATAHAEETP